jgi:FdhD protein
MSILSPASQRLIVQFNQGERLEKLDLLAIEYPLTVEINGKEFVTLLCSPMDLEDLAAGFLFSEGLIDQLSDVVEIKFNETEGDHDRSRNRIRHR